MDLLEAQKARRSVRGFLDREVPRATLERIFGEAQRSPSWCNIQPWRVYVTSGHATRKLASALMAAARETLPEPAFPFPAEYPEPYGTHRKECGKALYSAMGIERHDMAGRHAAWLRNFSGFGAPHLALVGLDPRFGVYGALDLGVWLQSVLLLATSEGVATCAQASLATYPKAARGVLPIPEDVSLLFGIALGYEDASIAANGARTTRGPLEDNVSFFE